MIFRLLTLVSFSFSLSALASVNVNNANFFVANTDFVLRTPGIDIDITRTYNSRSNYIQGYFGVGFSSDLESSLEIGKGKSNLIYHEGGGGNTIVFQKKGKRAMEELSLRTKEYFEK